MRRIEDPYGFGKMLDAGMSKAAGSVITVKYWTAKEEGLYEWQLAIPLYQYYRPNHGFDENHFFDKSKAELELKRLKDLSRKAKRARNRRTKLELFKIANNEIKSFFGYLTDAELETIKEFGLWTNERRETIRVFRSRAKAEKALNTYLAKKFPEDYDLKRYAIRGKESQRKLEEDRQKIISYLHNIFEDDFEAISAWSGINIDLVKKYCFSR